MTSLSTNKLNAKSRLLQTEVVESMPRLISDPEWPIDDNETNAKTLEKFLPTATHLETIDGFKLYKEGTPYDGSFFLVRPRGDRIVYYMEYEVHTAHFSGLHSVTQTSVWRKLGENVPRGLPAHVLFTYLVAKYPAVMSDKIQTTRGRDFWIDIMGQALNKGLTVELLVLHKNKVLPIESVEDIDMWRHDKTSAWNLGLQYEQLRFVIRK